jgi:hypothetical protein
MRVAHQDLVDRAGGEVEFGQSLGQRMERAFFFATSAASRLLRICWAECCRFEAAEAANLRPLFNCVPAV